MKNCQHQWRDDDAPVEICQLCNDFRPWEETVKDLRKQVALLKGQVEHKDDALVRAIQGLGEFQTLYHASVRKCRQMQEALIVARDCICFGSSLDEENNEACVQRALDKIDEALDQTEDITEKDAEYLRGEPTPISIQIPIEVEDPEEEKSS